MKYVSDHLREHLLVMLGASVPRRLPALPELRASQWSGEFEALQRNRLVVGSFRYGLLADQKAAGGNGYDNIGALIARAKAYQATGNLEHLVDVANLAMVEFEVGRHPNRHWVASDDGEHVGRVSEDHSAISGANELT